MYEALAIANYFVQQALNENETLDHLKLQKLLFFAYGWYLAIFDKELFEDEIRTWRYGPVVVSVYETFKEYRNTPINKLGRSFSYDFMKHNFKLSTPSIPEDDEITNDFLKEFWESFKKYSGIQLSNATHVADTPWDIASKKGKPVIDKSEIKSYFSSILENSKGDKNEKK
jgi:uncharacterized phage-associated protein